jgi:hypothetical protein
MSPWRSFLVCVHLASLGLWLGVSVGVVATAAIAFPAMKALGVRVTSLPESAENQHRFVAGAVAQRVFLFGDTVAFACALLSAASMAGLLVAGVWPLRRPGTLVRALAMGVALASLASMLLIVTPSINAASRAHFAAAMAGDSAVAAEHARAVDDLHPMASALMLSMIVSVLIVLLGGLWAVARGGGARDSDEPRRGSLPEPALLRGRGAAGRGGRP